MNNVILITGANSELGINYIQSLVGKNIKILALYRADRTELEKIKAKYTIDLEIIQVDLFDTDSLKKVICELTSKYHINQVLHLAAPNVSQLRFNKISRDQFDIDYRVQLLSIIEILQLVLPKMKKMKQGKIVFVLTSCTKGIPPKFWASYVTFKYGLLGLLKSLASEYSTSSVQINGVSPSMIDTKFLRNMDERIIEMSTQGNPQKRLVQLDEVVSAIDFFLSEKSNFITGNNLLVSGGEVF